jgi:hypothetical protein
MLTKKEIQNIIDYKVAVDCYDEHEVRMGWAIYMTENLNYPFEASYLAKTVSGKTELQKTTVVGAYTKESDFDMHNFFVEIEFNDFLISVDLDDLKDIEADEQTLETIEVWKSRNNY